MYAIRHAFTALALLTAGVATTATSGCAAADPSAETGTLALPLTTTTIAGELFRLSPATFEISGPGGTLVLDGSGDASSVSAELPPGITTVFLRPGWTLSRSSDGGATYQPVSALLGSANPLPLRVLADTSHSLSFEFLVRNPNGNLTVRFGVDTAPRQLAGGISLQVGTGDLAGYAGKRFDFSTYFTLSSIGRRVELDGAKTTIFTAAGNATEYFGDGGGVFQNVIGPGLTGSFLEYRATVKTDGSIEFSGEMFGGADPFPSLTMSVGSMFGVMVDANGFVDDTFFVATPQVAVQLDQGGVTSTASGRLTLRHLLQ